jgi:hypothetical protein
MKYSAPLRMLTVEKHILEINQLLSVSNPSKAAIPN